MFPIKQRITNHLLLSMAVSIASMLTISGCTPPANLATEMYKKGQAAEASKDWKQAEKYYIDTISAALDSKSVYHHLAAINRLTDLEVNLHNPSKSKSFMNQASTLAENDALNGGENSASKIALAQERHIAIMRLANWLFEEGNFISARRLYGKALSIEDQLKIDPNSQDSASANIQKLDSQENFEHSQVSDRISTNRYSTKLRGPEAAQRALNRRKTINDMQLKIVKYQQEGGKPLAIEILDLLAKTRRDYGSRENEYRMWLKNVANTLTNKDEVKLISPVIEEDIKQYSHFSVSELDAAKPEAVENATFYTEDLVMLAFIRQHQHRWKEMLEICEKAEQIAPKIVRKNSLLDYDLLTALAAAQEANGQRVKALPNRKRQLELFKKKYKAPFAYSDFLYEYAMDLIDAGRLKEAESFADETYKVKRNLKGESHIEPFFISYGNLLMRLNKPEKARTILLEGLPYLLRDNNTSLLFNCYVQLYMVCAANHVEEALEYNKRLQELIRKHGDFGQTHIMPEAVLWCVGFEIQLGRYRDALHTLEQGLAWQKQHSREPSAYTAGMWNGKANIYQHMRDWKLEKECRTIAIDICRKFDPPQPSPCSSTLFQAACQYQAHREFQEAEKYLREAIEVTEGKEEKLIKGMNLLCKSSLAICLFNSKKNPAEAANIKREILQVYKKSFSGDQNSDITLCLTLCELSVLLRDKTNATAAINEAELLYSKQKIKNKDILQSIEAQKRRIKTLPL